MAKKVVRIFLDSNVILSGLLSDKGPPRLILDLLSLELPFLVGSTGKYCLIEIERNLKKKVPEVLSVYKTYLPKLNLRVVPLPRLEEVKKFSGQIANKDIPVLASAFRGRVDFLVTGDKQHFEKLKISGRYPFKIVTPAEFLHDILPQIIRDIEKT